MAERVETLLLELSDTIEVTEVLEEAEEDTAQQEETEFLMQMIEKLRMEVGEGATEEKVETECILGKAMVQGDAEQTELKGAEEVEAVMEPALVQGILNQLETQVLSSFDTQQKK